MFIGKIVDRMDASHQSSAKYEDTTKTKYEYMTGLIDKAIAKVNQNELDWYEKFFQHSLFCIYKQPAILWLHSYQKSKF